ncbi:MAG TPA: adenosylmethionine decarboxylase [Candidatus Deferrimicrobium sp.]|nr:adenosylmethionine decarboxylase [Candidatus Deferrimicrobium sp.]
MKILGRHLIAEFSDCNRESLNNLPLLERLLKEAVRVSGATLVRSVFHRYHPQGVSGVVVIAESHLSVHTWPEYGYAAVDYFTCGNSIDPYKAFEYLKDELSCRNAQLTEIKRGMPSAVDEIIDHKPTQSQQIAAVATA